MSFGSASIASMASSSACRVACEHTSVHSWACQYRIHSRFATHSSYYVPSQWPHHPSQRRIRQGPHKRAWLLPPSPSPVPSTSHVRAPESRAGCSPFGCKTGPVTRRDSAERRRTSLEPWRRFDFPDPRSTLKPLSILAPVPFPSTTTTLPQHSQHKCFPLQPRCGRHPPHPTRLAPRRRAVPSRAPR